MKLLYLTILGILSLLVDCTDQEDRYNIDSDTMVRKEDIRKIKKGLSKSEILTLLGKHYRYRLTFRPSMKKEFENGHVVDVDFLLFYHYYEKNSQEYPGVQEIQVTKTIDIALFFEKGFLAEYYVRENPANEGFNNIKVLDDSGDFWPGAGCDLKYYRKKVNKSVDDGSLDLEHCDF